MDYELFPPWFKKIIYPALFMIVMARWLCPEVIPFTNFQFWKMNGSLGEAIKSSWILLVWGTGATILIAACTKNSQSENLEAESFLLNGLFRSVRAGVLEEICFRWILFYSAMVGIKTINWLIFGCLGWGFAEHMYTYVLCPIANWSTLGYMHDILFNELGWVVGAAVISSNGNFRNGHAYQGLLGYTNSWFVGMFLFFLMFRFGLVAAIVVHALYDIFLYVVRYVDRVIERAIDGRRGRVKNSRIQGATAE